VFVSRNVQALRFVAALWVAVFHLNLLFGLNLEIPWLTAIAEAGYAGVDVFFVISGYVIALSTSDSRAPARSAGLFLSQRFARIYCGWWPFFLIYLGYFALTQGIGPEKRLLSSFFLWPTLLPHHLLPIAWTLSFELFFYICTAAVLAWNRSRALPVMVVWAAVVVVLNLLWLAQGLYHPDNLASVRISQWFFFYPLTLEFIAGFVLHEFLRRNDSRNWIAWATGAVLFWVVIVFYRHVGVFHLSGLAGMYHAPERAFLWGGFSICLVAAVVRLERRGITAGTWAERLGDASYSLYLGHILLIELFVAAYAHMPATALPRGLIVLSFVVAMVALLLLYHLLVERPLYARARNLLALAFRRGRLAASAQ
jgi:exopolysaccharide production protein ExoZ